MTRGQTEQAAPRRRLTNNSNQTSIASIAAEFRETQQSHQATSASAKGSTSSAPTAKNSGRKNAGVSTPTFIKIDDDSEGEASDRDVREVQSKAKSPPQTRTQSKHTTPASVTRSSTSKKRSTPPPSSSSIDTEDTYQPKRPRTQQTEKEREREEEEGEEESNPRADLEAFANSLERLSRLLFAARDNLSRKQVGVLENDIHHDWKVDEMSTFVEGFLRGADALDGRLKD